MTRVTRNIMSDLRGMSESWQLLVASVSAALATTRKGFPQQVLASSFSGFRAKILLSAMRILSALPAMPAPKRFRRGRPDRGRRFSR
jgi:hypothetical protein